MADPFAQLAQQVAAVKSAAPSTEAPAAQSAPVDPFESLAQQVVALKAQSQSAPSNPATGPLPLDIAGWNTGLKMPGWLSRGMAGAGEFAYNQARGAGERLGMMSPQEVAQDQKLDAPLNATTAGKVGKLLGGIGWTAPAMLIPGVNTLVGGALLGSALGATTPTAPGQSALRNAALGAGTGLLGNFIGEHGPGWFSSILARRAQGAVDAAAPYAERDAVLSAAREAGYKVPPTAVRRNVLTTALESLSGKAATRQSAEVVNQGVTDSLVAQDLGLDPKAPISVPALRGARRSAGAVYQQVADALPSFESDQPYREAIAALGQGDPDLAGAYNGFEANTPQAVKDLSTSLAVDTHPGPAAVKMTKALRAASKATFQRYFRSQDPSDLALAQAQRDGAAALEGLIGRRLDEGAANGESTVPRGLAQDWKDARTTIAKSYQAAGALKNGHINAVRLGALLDRGAPMSDGMGLAGRFAQQFGEVARVPKSGPGVSKLAAMLGLAGEGGALYLHSPEAAAVSAATVAAPYAARGAILSDLGQRALATPKYTSAGVTALLRGLKAGSPYLTRLALPALTGGLAK